MITSNKKYINFFFPLALSVIFLFFFIYIIKISQDYYWRYVFSDWIINYEGGFIKRGLLGQLSIYSSEVINIDLKYIFIIFHILIYFTFILFFFLLFKDFKKNYIFVFFCFSPLVFLFPLYVNDALARKEIFYITLFLVNCFLLTKINSSKIAFIATNIFFIISCLIHEAVLFFSLFFYSSYYFFLFKKKIKHNNLINLTNFIIFILLFFIHTRPVDILTVDRMLLYITSDLNLRISTSSGAMSWLVNLNDKTSLFKPFDNISNFRFVFLHFIYLHFSILFYLIIFKFSYLSNKILKLIYIFNFIFTLTLFYIAHDWGRFVYIHYNFLLIFTFYVLHDNKDVFLKIDKIFISNKIPLSYKYIVTLIYISSWLPGLQYFDKTHLFPLYDFMIKNFLYLKKYSLILLN